jgi:hypothetical protein
MSTKSKTENHKKKWTYEDTLVIRYGVKYFTIEDIAERLGRSESSVRSKIRDLGISVSKERDGNLLKKRPKNSFWTEEREEYVKAQVLKRTIADVAEEIGKSEKSLSSKLRAMGIKVRDVRGYITDKKKPNAWTKREIRYLKNNAGIKSSIEIAKKLNRTRLSVKQKATRLGLTLEKNPWSQEQTDKLYELHSKGFTVRQMSEEIGRSIESVRTKMRGCMLEVNYIWSEEDIQYLVEQRNKGATYLSIAETLGRTKQACAKKYSKVGISKGKKGQNQNGKKKHKKT